MSILNNSLLLGADAGAVEYQIQRSLRFNGTDSAYLSRTPASAGNRKTWTYSFWLKYWGLNQNKTLGALSGSAINYLEFVGNRLEFGLFNSGNDYKLTTTQVFRDPSAWYHIVISFDSTQSTASNRVKIYINGSQVTAFDTANYPGQNLDGLINSNVAHALGGVPPGPYFSTADSYLADIHFIDGQALTPSSFAETNITTGQWVPKAYTGTYGTNGFRLAFADNSNNTATTLGKDSSPNGNNWTPNNLSVTAGAGNDSLVDTPTSYGTDTGAGGEVRGNYCTWNALNGSGVLANGNLDFTSSATTNKRIGTIGINSGKWYFESVCTAQATSRQGVGIGNSTFIADANGVGATTNSWGLLCESGVGNGFLYFNNSSPADIGTINVNDVINIAYDADADKLWFGINGAWYNSGNPAAGTNASFTGVSGDTLFPVISGGSQTPGTIVTNFGQRPFAYPAPSGFKALCDTNLPAPVVAKPNSVFDVKLYTGNGSSQTISGLGFSPDLVWVKQRNGIEWNILTDAVRGDQKSLFTNATNAEDTGRGISLQSSGFSLDSWEGVNKSTASFVAWAWDAGSSTATNTQGSITSQVRANASAGFSIVTWTGNGTSATVGHGLGVAPVMLIVKSRNTTNSWVIYHGSLGGSKFLLFDTSAAGNSSNGTWGSGDSNPTSTVFSVGNGAATNGNSQNMLAYCFAQVAGYSSFGSYTGNGSTDGPFVYTGFRPRWFLLKRADSADAWVVFDSVRGTFNLNTPHLQPHLSAAEANVSTYGVDFLSNGVKPRATDTSLNSSGGTYIYAAFAENPFQYARAR